MVHSVRRSSPISDPTTMARKYRALSLFSGAMGLDLGLDQTGRFELLACVEKEKAYCDTIRKNKANGKLSSELLVYEGDIRELDPRKVMADLGLKPGELDILVGGPPCQAFSTAGKRASIQDPRGMLLWDYIRFVDAFRPKFFLMENVRGLLSAAINHRAISDRPENGGKPLKESEKPGSVIRLFAEDLKSLEGGPYHLDCFEVNAVNYGAPQIRERAIFIGNRYNCLVDFPDPTHGAVGEKAQSELFEATQPWNTLGNALKGLHETAPVIVDFSPRKKEFLKLVPPGSNWRSLPLGIQMESMGQAWFAKGGRSGWWRRLSFDLPCPTLLTLPNHASTSLCHPVETRALSVREYARVQEFPDNWEICGKPSEQYAQIGNAVPVRLGAVAGNVIADKLDEISKRNWRKPTNKVQDYRIIYIQSHVRTRQWFKDGEAKLWRDGEDGGNNDASYSSPKTKRKVSKLT